MKFDFVSSLQLSYMSVNIIFKIILKISEIIFTSLLIIFIFLLIVAGTKKAGRARRCALPACKTNLAIYSRCAKSEKVCKDFNWREMELYSSISNSSPSKAR